MNKKILIVYSNYYPNISDLLVNDSKNISEKKNFSVSLEKVPGVFEIPAAISFARNFYDGFIALGCVIRGETSHYDYVCTESARGLMDLSISGVALGNGILTVENMEQANYRANTFEGNYGKGIDAALACISQIEIMEKYKHAKN